MPTIASKNPMISAFDGISLDLLLRGGFRPVPLRETRMLTDGVLGVALELGADERSAPAGSHFEIAVPLPQGPEIRHYSLVRGEVDLAIARESHGRGGSRWLHEHLPASSSVLLRGPRNTFGWNPTAPAFFVVGGIGITPVTAAIASAQDAGIDWHLLYVGRSEASMPFAAELLGAYGPAKVTLAFTTVTGRPDVVAAARQWITAGGYPSATVCTCGPASLMASVHAGFDSDPSITVVSEDFDSLAQPPAAGPASGATGRSAPHSEVSADGRVGHHPHGGDSDFLVELTDGSEVTVPVGCSIIDALSAAGVRTLSSCRKGTCGTCETVILNGVADHRDSILTAAEREAQESMMICVSRAQGQRIALDL